MNLFYFLRRLCFFTPHHTPLSPLTPTGERHGHGVFFYSDGSQYTGGWVRNKKQGEGLFLSALGNISGDYWPWNLLLTFYRSYLLVFSLPPLLIFSSVYCKYVHCLFYYRLLSIFFFHTLLTIFFHFFFSVSSSLLIWLFLASFLPVRTFSSWFLR